MDFSDRFLTLYPALATDLANLNTIDLKVEYPKLDSCVEAVRRYSILLSAKGNLEIYSALTEFADPKISLVLASARDKAGVQLFPSQGLIKNFMFGLENVEDSSQSLVTFNTKDIFVDGIKQVACALAASLLIGQLAQIPEQHQHAKHLEAQAIDDLNRIIAVPDLSEAAQTAKVKEKDTFYFEAAEFIPLRGILTVKVFITGLNEWIEINSYTGTVSMATIVLDLADAINSLTLTNQVSNLLASPVLAGKGDIYELNFKSRQRAVDTYTELVSVKFDGLDFLPFEWGVSRDNLTSGILNSLLLVVEAGKVSSLSSSKTVGTNLDTLYFREVSTVPVSGQLEYVISPMMSSSDSVTISANLGDSPDQAVTGLLNKLWTSKLSSKVVGSIVHNDTVGYSAIQLVAYVLTLDITEFVLDLLALPVGLEVALGTNLKPMTSFSNRPRSLTVKAIYSPKLAATAQAMMSPSATNLWVAAPVSPLVRKHRELRDDNYYESR